MNSLLQTKRLYPDFPQGNKEKNASLYQKKLGANRQETSGIENEKLEN